VVLRPIPLTSHPGAERWPTFSPDGRQVAFAWNGADRGNFDIYVKLVAGGDPLRLTTASADDRIPAWSPDGTSIAFARDDAIYTVSPLGGPERKIADVRVGTQLAWTPDGKAIAFSSSSIPVTILRLDTGERRQLTHPPQGATDGYFAFSPDGSRLAFVRALTRSNSGTLHVMTLPDGEPRAIELQNSFMYQVAWTGDSRDILASVERGAWGVWRVDADTGQSAQIAGLGEGAREPAVSGPSARLACRALRQARRARQAPGGRVAARPDRRRSDRAQ
jgi:Tol biopolymer transport system component